MEEETKINPGKLFMGGVPTGPDVDRIVKEIGIPGPGLIEHAKLEAIIGSDFRAARYRSVVSAWRAKLKDESNIGTDAVPGVGIKVLTAKEWSERQLRRHRGTARHAVRVHNETLLVPTEDLDEVTRRKHDHLVRATAALGAVALETTTSLRKALKAPAQNSLFAKNA